MLQLTTHPYLFVLIISASQDNIWVIYWNQVIVQPTGAFKTVSFVCRRWIFSWGWKQAKEQGFHSHTDGATLDSITFSWIWGKQILKHAYLQTDGKYHIKSSVFTVTKLNKEEVNWDNLETKQIFLLKKKTIDWKIYIYTLDDALAVIDSNDYAYQVTEDVFWDFPGGPVVKNLPVKAEFMGSIYCLGRSHMLWGD